MDERPVTNPAPAGRRLRVIGNRPLAHVLDLAVSRALADGTEELDAAHLRGVQQIVRREFAHLLRKNARAIRGIPKSEFMRELERSRDKIVEAKRQAELELVELRERASFLRTFIEGLEAREEAESERRNARLTEGLNERFRTILGRADLPAELANLLRRELVEAASDVAVSEWERALEESRAATRAEIERNERRIKKLMSSLAKTEDALARLSKLREDEGAGVASIYRTVQGLEEDDEDFARKREMLERIFEANVVLQANLRRR